MMFSRLPLKKAQSQNLWTAANLSGVISWIDADDATKFTLTGSSIDLATDKSGNNYNWANTNATFKPTRVSNAVNGKSVIRFEGDDYLDCSNLALFANTGYSALFCVFKKTLDTTTEKFLFHIGVNTNTYNSMWTIRYNTNDSILLGGRRLGTDSYQNFSSNNKLLLNQVTIIGAEIHFADSNAYLWINDQLAAENLTFQSNGNSDSTNPGLVRLGDYISGGGVTGDLCELVAVKGSSRLSTSDRQKLAGYLAHKWGTTSSLASDHPYKSSPPTV